jgi:hypothetical protein
MHGKWAFVNGVILIATIQMFPWALAMLDGPSAAAGFQAVLTIANIANPITFGLGSIIFPAVVQAYEEGSIRDAWRAAKTYVVLGAALLSLYVRSSPYALIRCLRRVTQVPALPYADMQVNSRRHSARKGINMMYVRSPR